MQMLMRGKPRERERWEHRAAVRFQSHRSECRMSWALYPKDDAGFGPGNAKGSPHLLLPKIPSHKIQLEDKILLGLSSPRKANLAGGDFNRETICWAPVKPRKDEAKTQRKARPSRVNGRRRRPAWGLNILDEHQSPKVRYLEGIDT